VALCFGIGRALPLAGAFVVSVMGVPLVSGAAGLPGAQAAEERLGGAATQEAVPVRTPDTAHIRVDFAFNYGGFQLGEATLRADFRDGTFEATSDMQTKGLADSLFQSTYKVWSTGTYTPGTVTPARYTNDFQGKGDKYQKVDMRYDADGYPLDPEADPTYEKFLKKRPVTREQRAGAVDPMSAWIHMLTAATASGANPCGTTIPIFDGRRRYDLVFTFVKNDEISVGRGGKTYKGPAFHCRMRFQPIAGYKQERMERFEQDEDALPIPDMDVWMVHLREEGRPAASMPNYLVPIKIMSDTPLGAVVMIAEKIRLKDAPRIAQKRD